MTLNKSIYEDGNGGQLAFRNNDIMTTTSLSILAYLAMFSGNVEANTKPLSDVVELHYDWWGNDKSKQSDTWINSNTERILTGIALNSQSLEKIKQAIEKDTEFLSQYGTVIITVIIVSLSRVKITIETNQDDNMSLIWDSTKNEIIESQWL